MKLSKRGFTLIELLAVIVVLAIIALVAVPLILGVVEKAKKGAAESSALAWINAVENQIAINLVDTDDTNNIPDGVITVSDLLSTYGVSVKGKIPSSSGTTTITNGKVTALNVEIDGYSITYDPATGKAIAGGSSSNNSSTPVLTPTVTITDKSVTSVEVGSTLTLQATKANTDSEITWTSSDTSVATVENGVVTPVAAGNTTITASAGGASDTISITVEAPVVYNVADIIYFDPVNNTSCDTYTPANSLNQTKIGCMKWYVIKDNGDSIDVLLDHNTTYTGVKWRNESYATTYENSAIKTAVENLGTSNNWQVTPRLISAEEVAQIINWTSYDGGSCTYNRCVDIYFGSLNNSADYSSQSATQKAKQQSFHWLFDYTNGCTSHGCEIEDSNVSSYWTSTPRQYSGSTNVWAVAYQGRIHCSNDGSADYVGIRPVVTIQKSNL